MKNAWRMGVLVALATAAGTREAGAQGTEPDSLGQRRWGATVYAGSLGIADDELSGVGMTTDAGILFGARLGYRFHPHWAVEGSYGYAGLDATSEGFGEVDGRVHLYHAGLVFLAPAAARAQVAVFAGAGGMRYAYDEFERRGVLLQGESWAHEPIASFGAGLVVGLGDRAGLRVDVRDHVQFCNAESEPIDETSDFSHCPLDDAVLHNPEVSGGLLLRF